mmetsp:Transcript_9818/g.30307  ORF Transcript_9818/g.30307 Transcript_9818/m.30307 type:complete len:526 (-) Transcript_9818:461-2038(-)
MPVELLRRAALAHVPVRPLDVLLAPEAGPGALRRARLPTAQLRERRGWVGLRLVERRPQPREQQVHELRCIRGRHEDDDLARGRLELRQQDRGEGDEAVLARHDGVVLPQRRGHLELVFGLADADRLLQREVRQALDGGRDGRGHEDALPRADDLHDARDAALEAHVEQPVRLVHHDGVEVVVRERGGAVQVVEQAAGRRHEHRDPLAQACLLLVAIFAAMDGADDDEVGLPHALRQDGRALLSELARRRHDDADRPGGLALDRLDVAALQELVQHRQTVRERLPAARLAADEDVVLGDHGAPRELLHARELGDAHRVDCLRQARMQQFLQRRQVFLFHFFGGGSSGSSGVGSSSAVGGGGRGDRSLFLAVGGVIAVVMIRGKRRRRRLPEQAVARCVGIGGDVGLARGDLLLALDKGGLRLLDLGFYAREARLLGRFLGLRCLLVRLGRLPRQLRRRLAHLLPRAARGGRGVARGGRVRVLRRRRGGEFRGQRPEALRVRAAPLGRRGGSGASASLGGGRRGDT